MSSTPILRTDRMVLRGWQFADLQPLADIYATQDDPNLHFVGGTKDRDDVWRIMCLRAGHWQFRGHGQFVLEDKESGQFVGWCGTLHHIEDAEPELHYCIAKPYRGRGFATEAVARVVEHADTEWKLTSLAAYIAPENLSSQRVVVRAGAAKALR